MNEKKPKAFTDIVENVSGNNYIVTTIKDALIMRNPMEVLSEVNNRKVLFKERENQRSNKNNQKAILLQMVNTLKDIKRRNTFYHIESEAPKDIKQDVYDILAKKIREKEIIFDSSDISGIAKKFAENSTLAKKVYYTPEITDALIEYLTDLYKEVKKS